MTIDETIQFLKNLKAGLPKDHQSAPGGWESPLIQALILHGPDATGSRVIAAATDAIQTKFVEALRAEQNATAELVLRHAEGEIQDNAYGRALFHLMMSQKTGGYTVGMKSLRMYHAGKAAEAFKLVWGDKNLGECLKLIHDSPHTDPTTIYVDKHWDDLTKLWLDYASTL